MQHNLKVGDFVRYIAKTKNDYCDGEVLRVIEINISGVVIMVDSIQLIENCATCKHWKRIKFGSEWQIFGECTLGETNTINHPNITFQAFYCSKLKYKRKDDDKI